MYIFNMILQDLVSERKLPGETETDNIDTKWVKCEEKDSARIYILEEKDSARIYIPETSLKSNESMRLKGL